ncbi:hypothetical protein OESDEN_14025 [Oesophagostomum dentatum]|uniref:CX domain-containing protein n=1 Tax=Oesophagostomum dentatum TaxID=61180 RepID=A0A0B1SQR8_OESDE|nr:hypothetical protein OESDEN_14025 [Oesophagostomum dentatum]
MKCPPVNVPILGGLIEKVASSTECPENNAFIMYYCCGSGSKECCVKPAFLGYFCMVLVVAVICGAVFYQVWKKRRRY